MKIAKTFFMFVTFCAIVCGQSAGSAGFRVDHLPFTIRLNDFDAKAELTVPAGSQKALPSILLIHGSDVADMDNTIVDDKGKVVSHIFLDLAEFLSSHGYAVIRYNKRYVNKYDDFDAARFQKLTLQDLLADAKTVLAGMRTNPQIDRNNIFVYGWSEGSAIAGQIASTELDIRGVVVQGAVAYSFSEGLKGLFSRTGSPYLSRFARDGKIGASQLAAALSGNGGIPAKMFTRFLLDRNSTPDKPVVAAFLDKNNDGLIDLDAEAKPTFSSWFSDANLGIYSNAQALPGLNSVASKLSMPILILQGANDGNTPKEEAEALNRALIANHDHTLKVYPGLGHSLGVTPSIIEDGFKPITRAPMQFLARWLDRRTK